MNEKKQKEIEQLKKDLFENYGINFPDDDPAWIMTLINNDMTNIIAKSNKKAEKILQEVKEVQTKLSSDLDDIGLIPFSKLSDRLVEVREALEETTNQANEAQNELNEATNNLKQVNTSANETAKNIMSVLEKSVPSLIEKHIDNKMQDVMKMYIISLSVVFVGTLAIGYVLFGKMNFLGG